MTREMFMLFAIGYYFLTMIIIVIVLLVISNKTKKKYLAQINELERQKNLVALQKQTVLLNKKIPVLPGFLLKGFQQLTPHPDAHHAAHHQTPCPPGAVPQTMKAADIGIA